LIELLVDLDNKRVIKNEHLVGRHSYIDADYMRLVESACCSIGPWLDNYRRVGGQFELLNLVLYFRVRQTSGFDVSRWSCVAIRVKTS
jgi:hypothetical protein